MIESQSAPPQVERLFTS